MTRLIEVPLLDPDNKHDESYTEYLTRLTARIHKLTTELDKTVPGNKFEDLNRKLKDEVSRLITMIDKRNRMY